MSELERRFHETWLGMVQPSEGLVVSIPVLVDAQCMERQPPQTQQRLVALCDDQHRITHLGLFFKELLGLAPELFDVGAEINASTSLYVAEGKQTLRPTMALRKSDGQDGYEMLVWDLPPDLDLDRPETQTGTWSYPPSSKFERLLRHCRVPIGLLTNRAEIRLVFAPHGESSGTITFRIEDMASVGGRPILDAFVMLLSANRWFGVSVERSLPRLLQDSRLRQANVTNDLAEQVFDALEILLRGFEGASERDGRALLDEALTKGGDYLYKGLLTVLLRLVFLLYAEDRALMPVEKRLYSEHLSLLALYDQLQSDHGAFPDSMSRRFGAWGRLIALFRAVYEGCAHGDLVMPPRRGTLFDPNEYPFLEGWAFGGSAAITKPEDRAAVALPTVDDETVFRVLEKLLMLDGQRLSYRALDVEQIGSVYEGIMGYYVVRVDADAVCLRPDRLWVTVDEVGKRKGAERVKWLKDVVGLSAAQADRLEADLIADDDEPVFAKLGKLAYSARKRDRAASLATAGRLVLQPGIERRRTSSHYTPRSLSTPVVRRTLEPLIAVMGDAATSERILNLKICDPAMGSGAFLVEACRYLADEVLEAWSREGRISEIARDHGDPLLHARRCVAQRCLYGVDRNDAAVELAKLSLWLVTLSKSLPFTFLDHSLRHGDSLVGLDFDQIRGFSWQPDKSMRDSVFEKELSTALDEAISLRQKIGDLGDTPDDDREKARLLRDAQDALDRIRLIGDLIVGAFFDEDHESERAKEEERARREQLTREWLASDGPKPDALVTMQRQIRSRIPVFHWMAEFPEVFHSGRPDPLDEDAANKHAYMDAFLGNPPYAGKNSIIEVGGQSYLPWLLKIHEGTHGNADLSAHFLRRCDSLLGRHGTSGFVVTNSIAQGDTRTSGLVPILGAGAVVYEVAAQLPWTGGPNVAVAKLHLAKGRAIAGVGDVRLDGRVVPQINSQLSAKTERTDAAKLVSNSSSSFVGSQLMGMGFTLTPEERNELIKKNKRNSDRIFPYLGGQEVTTNPRQDFERYVIDFGRMTLAEAEKWPDLLRIVRERVKPERDTNNRVNYREKWWQFGESRPGLYAALGSIKRCLVNSQVSKHVVFAFQPTGQVFGHTLYVYPIESWTFFATVQSRVHEVWARLLSSKMQDRAATSRVRYAPSDCFETFPFVAGEPGRVVDSLESIGRTLYEARATYMMEREVGLTTTYNRLRDGSEEDPKIVDLRRLHEELDRRVLRAYAEVDPHGKWDAVGIPPYALQKGQEALHEAFVDAVVDRLFALNAQRATDEAVKGLGTSSPSKTKGRKRPSNDDSN